MKVPNFPLSVAFVFFTALTAAFNLAFITSANADPSGIEDLRDGNYRFCDTPPQNTSTIEAPGTSCFRFRKIGDRIAGLMFQHQTGGPAICISGAVNGNIINGEAVESGMWEGDDPNILRDEFKGDQTSARDSNGFLRVGDGVVLEIEELSRNGYITGYLGRILYRRASFNLSSFYRYTAGTIMPPETCDRD
jgi:hypothetical protein